MNVAEAAEKLGVSQQRIRALIYNRRLKSTKVDGHHVIDEDSFNAMVNNSHMSLPIADRVRNVEERVTQLEGIVAAALKVDPDPPPEVEPKAEEPPEQPPTAHSADTLIASLSALFEDPRLWAKHALATAVAPDYANVTAFSLEGALRAYKLSQPQEIVAEAEQRIAEAGREWWDATYPGLPPPEDLQKLNDVVNHSQLMAILNLARGGDT